MQSLEQKPSIQSIGPVFFFSKKGPLNVVASRLSCRANDPVGATYCYWGNLKAEHDYSCAQRKPPRCTQTNRSPQRR